LFQAWCFSLALCDVRCDDLAAARCLLFFTL
jgi:hypothetical protein